VHVAVGEVAQYLIDPLGGELVAFGVEKKAALEPVSMF